MLSYLTITAGFSRVSGIRKYCIHFVEFILLGDENENFTKKTCVKKWLFKEFKEILLVSASNKAIPKSLPDPIRSCYHCLLHNFHMTQSQTFPMKHMATCAATSYYLSDLPQPCHPIDILIFSLLLLDTHLLTFPVRPTMILSQALCKSSSFCLSQIHM